MLEMLIRLLTALVSRAVRMRSRDAEGAAQEALKRSLANPLVAGRG